MPVKKIGDWRRAGDLLRAAPANLSRGIDMALRREAERFRAEVVKGIAAGVLGGQAFEPLSPLTIVRRRMKRKRGGGGTKPLIDRGDLRRAVTVQKAEAQGGYFAGIARGRMDRDGTEWVNIAATHEFGATMVLELTEEHRRYLMMLVRAAGLTPPDRPARQSIVIRIPPRPFLKPVADKLRPGMAERVLDQTGRIVLGI